MKKFIKPSLINKDFKISNYDKLVKFNQPNLLSNNFSQDLYMNIIAILFIFIIIISLIYRNKYKKNKNLELKEFINKVYKHELKGI